MQPDAFQKISAPCSRRPSQKSALALYADRCCANADRRGNTRNLWLSPVNGLMRNNIGSFQHEVHAATDIEFLEQCGYVKFHSAFRNIQLGRNLFIAEILIDARKNLILTTAQ